MNQMHSGPCSRICSGSQRPSGGSTPTSSYCGMKTSASMYSLPETSMNDEPRPTADTATLELAGDFFGADFLPPPNIVRASARLAAGDAIAEGAWKALAAKETAYIMVPEGQQ